MSDTVGNDLDNKALGVGDRLVPAPAIAHYAWKLQSFRDPAAVFLPIRIDRQIHSFIITSYDRKRRPNCGLPYGELLVKYPECVA